MMLMGGIIVTSQTSQPVQPVQDDRDIVIKTIMGEAADQGLDGMTAVAETIRNRASMRKMTPAEVALQPQQYSFWNDPASAQTWLTKYGTGDAYQMAGHAYENAFGENPSQLTDGATHYYNPRAVKSTPSWAKEYEHKGRIGNHEFYFGR